MHNIQRRWTVGLALFYTAALLQACGSKSSASTAPEHIRGSIQSIDGEALTVATSAGSVRVQLAPSTAVATPVQIAAFALDEGESCASIETAVPQASTAFKAGT